MHTLTLPRLGQTMTKGTLVEWRVEEGQSYEEGDELYVIETDKSSLDVEATLPGTIRQRVAEPGQELPVGALLAVVADPGEQLHDEDVEAVVREADGKPDQEAGGETSAGTATQTGSDRDENGAVGSQEAAASSLERSPRSAPSGSRPRATPRAKRLAGELSVDLTTVEGTGRDGTITEDDVRNAAGRPSAAEPSAAAAGGRVRERRRLTGLAKTVAEQMTRSWLVPQFSQDIEIDAAPLQRRRQRLAEDGVAVSFTDLLIEGLLAGVAAVPEVNATYDAGELVVYDSVDVSVAVATDRGLVVPVLRDCDAEGLASRAQRLADLVAQARQAALGPDAFSGGTITISNLGMSGIETGVPLINAPQTCILFAGSVIDKPIALAGDVVVSPRMRLVAAYDHRAIDGVRGAEFLTAVRDALSAA